MDINIISLQENKFVARKKTLAISLQICEGKRFHANLQRKTVPRKFATEEGWLQITMENGSSQICNRFTKHSFLANVLKNILKNI